MSATPQETEAIDTYLHTSYWDIQPLFYFLKLGDEQHLHENLSSLFSCIYSGDPDELDEKSWSFCAVSLINTFMIAAIQSGAYAPKASEITDAAMRKIGQIQNVVEIPPIVHDAADEMYQLIQNAKGVNTSHVHVENAKYFLDTHTSQEIHAEDVARAVGLSTYHLSVIFKSETGQTLHAYLTQRRIEQAKQRLAQDNCPISQISSDLRFYDQSYFTKVFRQHTGLTPRKYRSMAQQHQLDEYNYPKR